MNKCLFRIPADGGKVLLEITSRCNYHCAYCVANSGNKEKEKEMSTGDVRKALLDLKGRGFKYIKITGGEPFMRKDIMEVLEFISNIGLRADISTNASLITEEMARQLKGISLEMIHVSLDGHNEKIHERVRGKNTFVRTLKGIKILKKTGKHIRIGTVIYKLNQDKLEEIVHKAIEIGADEIIFSVMEPVYKMKGDHSLVITRKIEGLQQEIKGLRGKYLEKIKVNCNFEEQNSDFTERSCPALNRFIYITSEGYVAPCTWVLVNDSQYRSNVRLVGNDLKTVLEDEPIRQFLICKKECGKEGCLAKYEKRE